MPNTILVVDDHQLVLDGLISIVKEMKDFEIIASGRNGKEGLQLAETMNPDIILMDIDMRIEQTGSTITISKWKQKKPFVRLVVLIIFPSLFFFIAGLGAAIVAFLFFMAASLVGFAIDGLSNFTTTTIDFANKTIVSTSRLLGINLRSQKLDNVDFEALEFNEYRHSGGGHKKFVLEYLDGNTKKIVFRVNKLKEKKSILNEIKTKHNN